MRLRGVVWTIVILLLLVSIFQLSFTVVVRRVERWAQKEAEARFQHLLAEEVLQQFREPVARLQYVDSVQQLIAQYRRHLLDSLRHEVVYNLGIVEYTYLECKEREINLGLDLRGGISVLLQVDIPGLVREMAGARADSVFMHTWEVVAHQFYAGEISDFVSAFCEALTGARPDIRLAQYFASPELQGLLSLSATNDEVCEFLRQETDDALHRTYNILRTRIDRFGVAQPFITLDPINQRILVELPGIDDPYRVRRILETTARLEFWETYPVGEFQPYLIDAIEVIDEIWGQKQKGTADSDTATATPSLSLEEFFQEEPENPQQEQQQIQQPKEATLDNLDEPAKSPDHPPADSPGQSPQPATTDTDTGAQALLQALHAAAGATGEEEPASQVTSVLLQYFIPAQPQQADDPTPIIGYASGRDTARVRQMLTDPRVRSIFPATATFAWSAKPVDEERDLFALYALRSRTVPPEPALTGEVVVDARVDFDPVRATPLVSLTMNTEGARRWRTLTAENIGRCIAIVLDGRVYSAPVVQEEIPGGRSQIQGDFTIREAQDLAMVLETGRLPVRVRVLQEGIVGATLGKEAIQQSLLALLLGVVLVVMLIIGYYRVPGLLTVGILLLNLFLIVGILASLGATITLPGLAGLILTVGMAVDASIIIYERIKEELLKEGKGFALAIRDGFRQSRFAIADANITTLVAGLILLWVGIGPIRGFAVVLITGILTTILTAVFLAYAIFTRWIEKKREKWLQFGWEGLTRRLATATYPWMGKRRLFYLISGGLIALSLLGIILQGFRIGVEFTGGYDIVVRFEQPVSVEEVRQALTQDWDVSLLVRSFGAANQVKITMQAWVPPTQEAGTPSAASDSLLLYAIYQRLQPILGEGIPFEAFREHYVMSFHHIGPAFARDLRESAIWASILGLLFMFLYIAIRFRRWEFGLGAVAALIHDVLLVLGAYALLHPLMPFALEVNQVFIGALLTIIGYSINDTVVVFDRIREIFQLRLPQNWKHNITFQQLNTVFNRGITLTLSRTLGTSITTLLVLLALLIFGSETVQAFAFALFLGVLTGTYSSIFVAGAIAMDTMKRLTR